MVDFAVVRAASFSMIAWTISIGMSMLQLNMLGQDGDASILLDTADNDPNTSLEVREALHRIFF